MMVFRGWVAGMLLLFAACHHRPLYQVRENRLRGY